MLWNLITCPQKIQPLGQIFRWCWSAWLTQARSRLWFMWTLRATSDCALVLWKATIPDPGSADSPDTAPATCFPLFLSKFVSDWLNVCFLFSFQSCPSCCFLTALCYSTCGFLLFLLLVLDVVCPFQPHKFPPAFPSYLSSPGPLRSHHCWDTDVDEPGSDTSWAERTLTLYKHSSAMTSLFSNFSHQVKT